jgi:hypothetical protein
VVDVPVVEVGLKVPVSPVGSPLMVNDTAPVNPPVRVIVIVTAVFAPCASASVDGEALSVNDGDPPPELVTVSA